MGKGLDWHRKPRIWFKNVVLQQVLKCCDATAYQHVLKCCLVTAYQRPPLKSYWAFNSPHTNRGRMGCTSQRRTVRRISITSEFHRESNCYIYFKYVNNTNQERDWIIARKLYIYVVIVHKGYKDLKRSV